MGEHTVYIYTIITLQRLFKKKNAALANKLEEQRTPVYSLLQMFDV